MYRAKNPTFIYKIINKNYIYYNHLFFSFFFCIFFYFIVNHSSMVSHLYNYSDSSFSTFFFSFLSSERVKRGEHRNKLALSLPRSRRSLIDCFVLPEPVLCARGVRWYRQKEASASDKVRMEIESEKKSRRKMVPLFFQSVRCCSTSDPPRRSSDGCHRWP